MVTEWKKKSWDTCIFSNLFCAHIINLSQVYQQNKQQMFLECYCCNAEQKKKTFTSQFFAIYTAGLFWGCHLGHSRFGTLWI